MSKVLITGAEGMLGTMLTKVLKDSGSSEVIATGRSVENTDIVYLDITEGSGLRNCLKDFRPDFVVNCAAYTNVELAEDPSEKDILYRVNAEAPGVLAQVCAEFDIGFIHISTDYVFGQNSPEGYDENTIPLDAVNEYGRSKLEGERAIMSVNTGAYILRTSWIFGPNGKNFVDTMLNLAKDRTELGIVDDEYGVPNYTHHISRQIIHVINNSDSLEPGIYHVVSEGSCSRYEQAKEIFESANIEVSLNRVSLKDYSRKARIPNHSVLKNTKLPKLPTWQSGIRKYINSKS